MKPKISVIMSVYKPTKEGFLRSVESVLCQTLNEFEFIIINDDDTKYTQILLHEIELKDERIKIIQNKKNIGLVKSLNKGLLVSSAKYIARIDVDDWWLPNKLELQYKFMLENKLDLSGTLINFVDEDLNILNFFYNRDAKMQIIKGKNPFVHSSVIFKKFDNVFYNEKALFIEDFELWCRYYIFGKIGSLNKVLTNYVISNDGITGTKRYLMFINSVEVYKNFVKQVIIREKKDKRLINKPLYEMNSYDTFINNNIINKAIEYKSRKNRVMQYLYSVLVIILKPKILYYLLIRGYYRILLKKNIIK